jgi:hypothetical protein
MIIIFESRNEVPAFADPRTALKCKCCWRCINHGLLLFVCLGCRISNEDRMGANAISGPINTGVHVSRVHRPRRFQNRNRRKR